MGKHNARHAMPEPQWVAALWVQVIRSAVSASYRVPELLDRLTSCSPDVVDEQATQILVGRLGALWSHGWQPAELRRELRRRTKAATGRLAELAILVDHEQRSDQRLDPRWAEQLRRFEQRTVSTQGNWLGDWRRRESLDPRSCYAAVVDLALAATELPHLDVLIPPPGADASAVTVGAPERGSSHHPMLDRIRKLLMKAEATEFEAEAATFTAKAQELMTRHAIDEAAVRPTEAHDGPRMVRLPLDPPYADAKSVLLATVAKANRCRAVYLKGIEMSSMVGHAEDLAVVELLYTSLLVQAQNALAEAGRGQAGRRTRSQRFRSSFFLAYAGRIGERLDAVNEQVAADSCDSSALPVLRARESEVEEFVDDHYGGRLTAGSVRGGYDGAGLAYGREAADRAKLDSGVLTR